MMDVAGTVTTERPASVTISTRANEPGRSTARSFGISASTISVRFCSCTIGESRTTRPLYSVASPSRVSLTTWPLRTPEPSRSGMGTRSRSGCTRTSVATVPRDRVLRGIAFPVGAGSPGAQPSPRLLGGGLGLVHAQLETALIDPADRLPALDARAEVDGDLRQPAGHLGAEDDQLVGGQRPGGGHGASQRALGGGPDRDFPGRRTWRLWLGLIGARDGLSAAAGESTREGSDQGQDTG